ncbi:MAG: chemotaxis-specific protein-glutamate methyltransferase CheB [Elusimicrobia bacterium]|nr:chemotaxis-specific protein-glutamate methyltransferase CheB [Elusimicrobiota bacterium]
MSASPIRVVVADDSATVRGFLAAVLKPEHGFQIVGEAPDGRRCVELVSARRPDIVLLDVDMPEMDGLAATVEIMRTAPTPIVIFTSSVVSQRFQVPIKALAAGALEVLHKPAVGSAGAFDATAAHLRDRLRLLSQIKVIRRRSVAPPPAQAAIVPPRETPKILAIGASTGGPSALVEILKGVPRSTPLSVLLVQHMSGEFMHGFVAWLKESVSLPVREAAAGDRPSPGTILVSPGGRHLALARGGVARLDDSPPRHSCRPSIDVLFESVAEFAAPRAIGVLLTGIGSDGAAGLLEMRRRGCVTVAQDEASSVVYGMPKAAVDLGAAEHVLDLEAIARLLKVGAEVPP